MTPVGPFPRTRVTGAFERQVARALTPVLEEGGARVVVACSGGPDSTAALVAVMRAVGAERVVAAHFDHRLRSDEEAASEREVVERVAGHLGVTIVCGRAARRPRDRAEEAAREARYRWLASACREAGASVCVTGHTLDDQAETVLLRLARGTGGGGAAAMVAVAPWPVKVRGARSLRVVRPLLYVSRVKVERYLAALGIDAASDPSNESLAHARNRVRQRVIPELRAVSPGAVEQIARFASLQGADDEALTAWAREELARIGAPLADEAQGRGAGLDRRALRALPPAVAARCLRLAAESVGLRLDGAQVEALRRACGRRGQVVALAGGEGRTGERLLELRRGA